MKPNHVKPLPRYFTLLIALGLWAGCSYEPPVNTVTRVSAHTLAIAPENLDAYDLHVISHNTLGSYQKSDQLAQRSSVQSAKDHIELLINKINRLQPDRILVFCHGGLNARDSSVHTAKIMCREIMRDTGGKTFPICITWRSGFFTTYWSNLVHMRSGIPIRSRALKGPMYVGGLLFRLPTDVLTGVARIPRNYPLAVDNALQNWDTAYAWKPNHFPVKYSYNQSLAKAVYGKRLSDKRHQYFQGLDNIATRNRKPGTAKFHTSLGRTTEKSNKALALQNVLMSPLKAATLPLVDSIGAPAWKSMTHRTRALVRPNSTLVVTDRALLTSESKDNQALKILMARLAERKHKHRIELYGHSMGTMVFNEIVREILQGRFRDPGIDKIVYMGAACSVKDFTDTVGAYLKKPRQTQFYNLCLHPVCEVREVLHPVGNIAVSGSLLVWIDSFYESPRSPTDRTLGYYMNAINLWRYMPQTENVTVKAFGHQQRSAANAGYTADAADARLYNAGPQKHGQFTHYKFWRSDFQRIKPAGVMPVYKRFRNK